MQLTIRMPDDQMSRIEHIAKKLGLKKSDVTRMAIKKFIEEYNDSTGKPFVKVKHLLGIVESGVKEKRVVAPGRISAPSHGEDITPHTNC